MFLIVAIITNEVSNTDRKKEKNHTKDVWLYFRTCLGIPSLPVQFLPRTSLMDIHQRDVYRGIGWGLSECNTFSNSKEFIVVLLVQKYYELEL